MANYKKGLFMKKLLLLPFLVSVFSLNTIIASSNSVPGEMIVKIKDNSQKSQQFIFNNFKNAGLEVKRKLNVNHGGFYLVNSTNTKSFKSNLKSVNSLSYVEYAEPNFIYTINPISNIQVNYVEQRTFDYPNDERFDELWGLHNTGEELNSVAGADVAAKAAWGLTIGSPEIKIAVIDTGVNYTHPDLINNIWTNQAELNGTAGVDDDGNGYVDDIHGYDFANKDGDPMDDNGHGSHCSGTIGAIQNNGIGVAGVMGNVSIVGVKFLTGSGSGTTASAIESIDYARKLGVHVMSNSWGGGGFSAALKESIEKARDAGIIFAAAAGNSRGNNDTKPVYPSSYKVDNIISVAAHDIKDQLASFSCYGKRTVHVAAPGVNILSTWTKGKYKSISGTSMATPHVSGVLGLFLAYSSEGLTPAEVIERVMITSVPTNTYKPKLISGGRINAYNLLTNTRPERSEPNPDAWLSKMLDTPFESAHPYVINANIEKTVTVAGAKYIRVVIKKFEFEKRYDKLNIFDKNGGLVETVTNEGEDYKTFYIVGDTVKMHFTSDRSVVKWGFIIEKVEYQI